MIKHFVEFYSPGTFTSEVSIKPVDSWDVNIAMRMAREIKERHGATPYGFRFITRERTESDLDSKVTNRSNLYYLGGVVETYKQVCDRNDPKEEILRWNMKANSIKKVIINTNSYRVTMPLNKDDIVLQWEK